MREKEVIADFEEISLKEIIVTVLKGKWLIAAITLICIATGVAGVYIINNSSYSVSSIIEFSFENIRTGHNPDGSRFDVNEISSPYIITTALDNMGIEDISLEDVRKRMTINPIIPADIQEIAKTKIGEGENFTYYPATFEVVLAGDKQLGLNEEQTIMLVDEITNTYMDSYINRYSDIGLIPNILTQFDSELLDYPEMSTVITKQIDILISYLSSKAEESPTFRSSISGYSFNDVLQSLSVIKSIDLRSMDSTIGLYLLTKDKQKLINSYRYSIELKQVEMNKAENEALIARDMMDSFDTSSSTLIVPGIGTDLTAPAELKNDQSYYDSLANRSTNASVLASDTLLDIEYLTERISKLENDNIPYSVKSAAIDQVMGTIDRIQIEIAKWVDVTNELIDEYYNIKYAKAIIPVTYSQILNDKVDIKLAAAVSAVLGLMVGIFVVMFRSYWMNGEKPMVSVAVGEVSEGNYGA